MNTDLRNQMDSLPFYLQNYLALLKDSEFDEAVRLCYKFLINLENMEIDAHSVTGNYKGTKIRKLYSKERENFLKHLKLQLLQSTKIYQTNLLYRSISLEDVEYLFSVAWNDSFDELYHSTHTQGGWCFLRG